MGSRLRHTCIERPALAFAPWLPYQEGAGLQRGRKAPGRAPGGRASPMEEAQPRANSQASSRLRRHPPGQGVELQVHRRVRGSLWSGVWLEGRVPRRAGWASDGTQREVGSRPGWVLSVLWDSCSRRQGGQRNRLAVPWPLARPRIRWKMAMPSGTQYSPSPLCGRGMRNTQRTQDSHFRRYCQFPGRTPGCYKILLGNGG